MDRNLSSRPAVGSLTTVALRKESVDRNPPTWMLTTRRTLSLSARRAWIEIALLVNGGARLSVALRKESVDRNSFGLSCADTVSHVALRKESVDRNYMGVTVLGIQHKSLSARRAWIEILLCRILFRR